MNNFQGEIFYYFLIFCKSKIPIKYKEWWPDPESNWGHKDFQSFALPTELSGLVKFERLNYNSVTLKYLETKGLILSIKLLKANLLKKNLLTVSINYFKKQIKYKV